MKAFIKNLLVPKGRHLRRLRGGIAKGSLMNLDLTTQSQRYWGLDERELLPALQHFIGECRSLVDVGANDGYYTMAFLRSSAERVIACEPGSAIQLLLMNAEANHYYPDKRFSVETSPIGLGDTEIRLSKIVADLPRPILIKVDIEGAEFDALKSMEECPVLPSIKWIIETHSRELEDLCEEWLMSRGYRARVIRNARWRRLLPEWRPIPHNRWLVAEIPN